MTYDPGKILPNMTCPNCGFVGLMKVVGGGAACNQCGFAPLYTGRKPGYPNLAAFPLRFLANPTYPPGTEPPANAPLGIQLPCYLLG
jgi:DNA-directed RNA polymerase subunit RPC12/RpoP